MNTVMQRTLGQHLAALQRNAANHDNHPTDLNLLGLQRADGASPRALVKLKWQGNANFENEFAAEHKLTIVERLPLPGPTWQQQVLLNVELGPAGIAPLKTDPRVGYAVPNAQYVLETARPVEKSFKGVIRKRELTTAVISHTDAAGLVRAITNAERLKFKIRTRTWSLTDNLALEDALRRASHCLEMEPTPVLVGNGNVSAPSVQQRGEGPPHAPPWNGSATHVHLKMNALTRACLEAVAKSSR